MDIMIYKYFFMLFFLTGPLLTSCAQSQATDKVDKYTTVSKNYYLNEKKTEPKWVKLVEGSDIKYEEDTKKFNQPVSYVDKIDLDKWNSFLKSFIESLPIEKRDAPLRALLSSEVVYDSLENIYNFHHGINIEDSLKSHGGVRFYGQIKNKKVNAWIGFAFDSRTFYDRNYTTLRVDRIKIYADEFKWEKEIKFSEHTLDRSAKEGLLSLSDKGTMEVIRQICNSKKAVIRYYGDKYYDFEISAKGKDQLRLCLKAFEDINSSK